MKHPFERTDVALPMDPAIAAAVADADLGLARGAVELAAPSPRWSPAYAALVAAFAPTRPHGVVAIEHVGSTSVPGLTAKAILDIAVGISEKEAPDVHDWLVESGFLYRGASDDVRPDRMYGLEREIGVRLVNAHVVVHDGLDWCRYLAFRDRLRANDRDRDAYAALKRRLAAEHLGDRLAYIRGKSGFIVGRRG
ncbi:hypothetical protein GCM10010915_23210 [Microbacterium faecale]|uniref:GrpB family protein n=1 Tax=Microbacterium faecale TaxID=1804630 RepID=A0A916YFT1_9MICO|nr:GrpB family protein [Microbacterium faecale]GGD41625.1 hypothetical protein GCM10010915_23210 [Microbacterium faecale]